MNTPHSIPVGPRRRCANDRRHDVTVVREALLSGPPAEVFDYIAGEGVLPELLTGYGPLPAVTGTSQVSGPWSVPGSQRIVHTADGHTIREQVVLYERPRRFAYCLWGFSHPLLRRLADGGSGDWTFTATAQGTHVRWAYTFSAGSRLQALPLALMARWLWTGYMDTCLANARRIRSGP